MEELSTITAEIRKSWTMVGPLLHIRHEREYDRARKRLDHLLDEMGSDEPHPLYGLLDTLGTVLHAYEEQHHGMSNCSGVELLSYFMEEHGLAQSALPEVGSQGVVSEILRGKRELNIRQIRALARRFHVSPAVFI